MDNNSSSYRQIIKATSLFGGVQVVNIIIQIIRSKIISILLGPAGMGIVGLLNSTTGLITSITHLGLGTSAVKNVSISYSSGDESKVAITVSVLRKLVWITGLFGTILTIILAPWLSQITFGNQSYKISFIWLSITLLFSQISSGQLVVLQGLRKLQYLAKANLFGSALGLVITVPLYYIFHLRAIVPSIILTIIISMTLSWYYSNKVKLKQVKITRQLLFDEGIDMVRMGFMLSLSGIITITTSYILRIYISHIGSVEQVGLYSAGFAIINTYVGLVFTAMSTDYYPRLSAISQNNAKASIMINQQGEIAILILSPILIFFIIFINWIVIFLYSNKFLPVYNMLQWAALGMYFKASSFPIGYIMLAKGASKTFFWSELIANSYLLILNILGYKFFSLDGLGISFLVGYFLVLIQVYLIAKFLYGFKFNIDFYRIFIIQFALAIINFIITKILTPPSSYFVGIPFILLSTYFAFKELNKRINISMLISQFKTKF